jgi:hypothetical protein
MTPEDVIYLFDQIEKLIIINQALLYVLFVLLGGLAAMAFFTFWKKVI